MATETQKTGVDMVGEKRSSGESTDFRQAVLDRLGIMPNALQCAPEAPEIVEWFWDFVKGMFIDNPIASLFKERLFVYLSRFCEFRYCITRHCGFLIGRGHASGDPAVQIETAAQVIRLLKKPTPWQRDMNPVLLRLEAISTPVDWPEPETELEDCLFAAATALYVEPRLRDREWAVAQCSRRTSVRVPCRPTDFSPCGSPLDYASSRSEF